MTRRCEATAVLGHEDATARPRSARPRGWTIGRRLSAIFAALGILLALFAAIGGFALRSMDAATNKSIALLDPAQVDIQVLVNDLDSEQSSVRTFLLSGSKALLFDYNQSPAAIASETAALHPLIAGYPTLTGDLGRVIAENTSWRSGWADPSIALKEGAVGATPALEHTLLQRTNESAVVLADATTLANDAAAATTAARNTLNSTRSRLTVVSIIFLLALIATAIVVFLGLRRWVGKPIEELDEEVGAVAGGDLRRDLASSGVPEIVGLAASVGMMRDRILEQVEVVERARSSLAEQAEALRRANADLEQFADVASHDLQEPLRKVAGFCDLLIERYGDRLEDRGLEFVQYAADGCRRMRALIDDLLTYSRVTENNARMRDVGLGEVVRVASRHLSGMLDAAGARLEVGDLPHVWGDPSLLEALFENLLRNSTTFRGLRPLEIRIAAETGNGIAHVTVADNGQGIQPEYAEQVFSIFQRLHHDDATGTGLGLALCRRIVEVHHGRIWVDLGRFDGATLHVELPTVDPHAAAALPLAGGAGESRS